MSKTPLVEEKVLNWITAKVAEGRGAVIFAQEENAGLVGVWIGDHDEKALGVGETAEEAVWDAMRQEAETASTQDPERVVLTFEQAVAMLPDSERVHTFRQAGSALLGADWERGDLFDAFKKHPPELSGEAATNMKHGIVFEDEHGFVFVQTKEVKP